MEQYYKKRDGTDYAVPKGIINKTINPYDLSTYLVHLENMNYPYIIDEWVRTREYCVKNNMIECIFPKYIAKMNLAAYKKFTWKNTEEINQIFNNSKFIYNDLERLEKIKMTTKEFLDKYDNKEEFTEEELYRLWIGDVDIDAEDIEEGIGKQYRWQHIEWRVIKIQNRYFEIARSAGNTEYQPNEYDCQPIEVRPVEKTIIIWEGVS